MKEFIGWNWAAIAMTLTCVSLAIWFVVVLAKYVRISLNLFLSTPPPPTTAHDPLTEGEAVQFPSVDGVSLSGAWLWAYGQADGRVSRGTLVFCHEFGAEMSSCRRYVAPLVAAGYNVFTFDFRNHGTSASVDSYKPLQWPSDLEVSDVLGATTYAAKRLDAEGLPSDIALLGVSRGGSAGILAAAADPNIRAIVCDGAFSTEEVCISMMKRWAHMFARVRLAYEHHPATFWRLMAWALIRRAQRRTKCKYLSVRKTLQKMEQQPILFIHGCRDRHIDQGQARRLHAAAAGTKQLWLVAGAKHNQSVDIAAEAYARRTVEFFDRYLVGRHLALSRPQPVRTRPDGLTATGTESS